MTRKLWLPDERKLWLPDEETILLSTHQSPRFPPFPPVSPFQPWQRAPFPRFSPGPGPRFPVSTTPPETLVRGRMVSAPQTRGGGSSGSSTPSVNDMLPNTQRDYDFLPGDSHKQSFNISCAATPSPLLHMQGTARGVSVGLPSMAIAPSQANSCYYPRDITILKDCHYLTNNWLLLYKWPNDDSMCEHSMCEHSMCEHSMLHNYMNNISCLIPCLILMYTYYGASRRNHTPRITRKTCKCRCGCYHQSAHGSIYCTMCSRQWCACETPDCCPHSDTHCPHIDTTVTCDTLVAWVTSTLKPLKPSCKTFILLLIIMYMPMVSAPQTRGGGSSGSSTPSVNDMLPNTQRDYDFLPGMKRWNGIPFHDFLTVWWVALCIALGTISMDGVTLLTTAEGNDPHKTSTDAEEARKYTQRKTRVYCCIMNYIKPTSRCARIANDLTHGFRNDGPGLFAWLKVFGQLEIDDDKFQEQLREWDESTMLRAGIRNNDPEGLWLWLEYLENLSFNMKGTGKSATQMRKKFFEGLPEWFETYVASERLRPNPGSYVIAANYPAHHPKSGSHGQSQVGSA